MAVAILKGVELADVGAIHASHTARVVDAMVGDIDAGSLTAAFALVAVLALVGVDDRFE